MVSYCVEGVVCSFKSSYKIRIDHVDFIIDHIFKNALLFIIRTLSIFRSVFFALIPINNPFNEAFI